MSEERIQTLDALNLEKWARGMREKFLRVRHAEKQYRWKLMGVARQIGLIIQGFAPGGLVQNLPELMATLEKYETVLDPWARQVAAQMLEDVNRRDKRAWTELGQEMGRSIRNEIESTPIGSVYNELLEVQVAEIKSLPGWAAERVYARATEVIYTAGRAEDIAAEIRAMGGTTEGKAKMIAKSAVSTASTNFVEARAIYIGSSGYTWRTTKSEDVRKDHRVLEGTWHAWSDPPIVDTRSGYRSHPGCNANCECYAEITLPVLD
jgi:uncharacterized protein with gpF-like domain